MTASYLWIDGEFVPNDENGPNPRLQNADSVTFADIRSYETASGPALFRLKDQVDGFLNDAETAGFMVGYSFDDMCEYIQRTMAFNGIREGHVRSTLFKNGTRHTYRQFAERGNQATLVIGAWDQVLGTTGAMSESADSETAFPDRAALFIAKNGLIITPPSAQFGNAVIRNSVITLAADLGYAVVEQLIRAEQLGDVDEAFFSMEIGEIRPLQEFDGQPIAEGKSGPLTQLLTSAFHETTQGRGRRSAEWLEWIDEAYLGI